MFHELIDELRALEGRLYLPDVPLDDQSVLEGYKWIFTILAVGLDAHVWADPARPRFVDIVGPYRKWGGDNSDAFYQYAPIDPGGPTWSQGQRGDADYLSLTVYGGPSDGRYSERIVGTVNDRSLDFADDGTFSLVLSPDRHDGAWIKLEPDAVCAITRDYLADPERGVGGPPGTSRRSIRRPPAGRTTPIWPAGSGPRSPGCATRPRSSPSPSGPRTPSTSPTRCPARHSAGRPATPPTPWAATPWTRTRRW